MAMLRRLVMNRVVPSFVAIAVALMPCLLVSAASSSGTSTLPEREAIGTIRTFDGSLLSFSVVKVKSESPIDGYIAWVSIQRVPRSTYEKIGYAVVDPGDIDGMIGAMEQLLTMGQIMAQTSISELHWFVANKIEDKDSLSLVMTQKGKTQFWGVQVEGQSVVLGLDDIRLMINYMKIAKDRLAAIRPLNS